MMMPKFQWKNTTRTTRWRVLVFMAISLVLVAFQLIQFSISSSSNTQTANQGNYDVYNSLPTTTTGTIRSNQNSTSATLLPNPKKVLSKQKVLGSKEEEEAQGGSFSACLIVMDDNHFLIEWLAYHWHVLPLRRLIVAVDPRSHYSPTPIFDRYRDRGLMHITEWTDTDFMMHPPNFSSSSSTNNNNSTSNINSNINNDVAFQFVQRQLEFYAKCIGQLKQEGRSWTLFTDTDEFITLNQYAAPAFRISNMTNTPANANSNTHTSLLQKLEQVQQANVSSMMSSPCVVLPRLRFGTKESTTTTTTTTSVQGQPQYVVPFSFSDMDFMTLRWQWRAKSAFSKTSNNRHNGMPKCMVNVQYVQDSMLIPQSSYEEDDSLLTRRNHPPPPPSPPIPIDQLVNAHRPVMALCSDADMRTLVRQASFVAHHYPGTLEQWTFRDDGRAWTRNQEAYTGLAKRARKWDDSIRPWLQDLVSVHGDEVAQQLLDGVGQVTSNSVPFRPNNNQNGR